MGIVGSFVSQGYDRLLWLLFAGGVSYYLFEREKLFALFAEQRAAISSVAQSVESEVRGLHTRLNEVDQKIIELSHPIEPVPVLPTRSEPIIVREYSWIPSLIIGLVLAIGLGGLSFVLSGRVRSLESALAIAHESLTSTRVSFTQALEAKSKELTFVRDLATQINLSLDSLRNEVSAISTVVSPKAMQVAAPEEASKTHHKSFRMNIDRISESQGSSVAEPLPTQSGGGGGEEGGSPSGFKPFQSFVKE